MMAMLEAGGITPLIDDHRPADDSNRNGYYEYEPVLSTRESAEWVPLAAGKAVKVIYALLDALPARFEYRVLFMVREIREVVESQQRLLNRLGRESSSANQKELENVFSRERQRALNWLRDQPNFRVLEVDYASMINTPLEGCGKVAHFLDRQMDVNAMSAVASPQLRTVT